MHNFPINWLIFPYPEGNVDKIINVLQQHNYLEYSILTYQIVPGNLRNELMNVVSFLSFKYIRNIEKRSLCL